MELLNKDIKRQINILKQNIRSDCNKHIIKREHYTRKNGEWKPKQKFETEQEALSFIKKHKMYKYTAYICKVCGKWHIGIKNINKIYEKYYRLY